MLINGCATVLRGTHQPFRITSLPSNAQVALSTGETCVTPCTLDLPRAGGFQVRVSKPGFVTQVVPVMSKGSGAGVVGILGNAVLGGIAGAGADADNGSMRSLSPNPLNVRLATVPPVQ